MNGMSVGLNEVLKNTILFYYPKYFTKKIVQLLLDKEVITEEKQMNIANSLNVSAFETNNEKIIFSLNERPDDVLKVIEKCEFDKSYAYSILFDCPVIDLDSTVSLIRNRNIAYNIDELKFNEQLDLDLPIFNVENNTLFIKFNKLAKVSDFSTARIVEIKIPALLVLHFDDNIVEVRFDVINEIGSDNEFWKSNLFEIRNWFEQNLENQLINMDLYTTINYIVENKTELAIETATKMNLKDNRQAELNSSSSQDNTLPLLGDLKRLIDENKEVFEESPVILSILSDFINEVIGTSNCFWRMLSFNYMGREKELDAKITFTYKGSNHDLIQFYRPQKFDKEKMNYVVKFIAKCRREAQRT